ncbi:unnamed protein product [Somion occarium]|uniref:Uncharacterized protein n=1 Tax=Somion occarium TaxID=3059160 RepID=A0ABP1E7U5_9APHY
MIQLTLLSPPPTLRLFARTSNEFQLYQDVLQELNGIMHTVLRALFGLSILASAAEFPNIATKVDDFRTAFSDLSWVVRDVAGDIRTASIDFRYAIWSTIQDPKLSISSKLDILDSWMKSLESKKLGALRMPDQFHRFCGDFSKLSQEAQDTRDQSELAIEKDIKSTSHMLQELGEEVSPVLLLKTLAGQLKSWIKKLRFAMLNWMSRRSASTNSSIQATPGIRSVMSRREELKALRDEKERELQVLQTRKRHLLGLHSKRDQFVEEVAATCQKIALVAAKVDVFSKMYHKLDEGTEGIKHVISEQAPSLGLERNSHSVS